MTIEQQKESAREDLRLAVDIGELSSGFDVTWYVERVSDFNESELLWLAAFRQGPVE